MKIKYLAFTALLSGFAFAGVDTKTPVVEEPVCVVPWTGDVSVGYETDYFFRGVQFSEDNPWASVNLNFPLFNDVSLDLGAWYLNGVTPAPFDELDVYGFVNFPLSLPIIGDLAASVGGTWFYFPETAGGNDTAEVSANVAKDLTLPLLGDISHHVFAAHDFEAEGFYFQTGLDKVVPLSNCLDLELGGGVSYTDDYFGSDGWNHAFATAGVAWHWTEAATLRAYVGGNFVLDGLEPIVLPGGQNQEDVHGGASLSISF